MRFLKESLLSFFVVGLVLYLYFVAAGAALCSLFGFMLHREQTQAMQRLKIAAA